MYAHWKILRLIRNNTMSGAWATSSMGRERGYMEDLIFRLTLDGYLTECVKLTKKAEILVAIHEALEQEAKTDHPKRAPDPTSSSVRSAHQE